MKTIDFVIQSTIIGLSLVMALIGLFYPTFFYLFLIGQLIIGAWQYVSALIAALFNSAKYRKKYFALSSAYLISLVAFVFVEKFLEVPPSLFVLYLIIPAWCLAVYYYRLTWRTIFIDQKTQSGFLPHTNF